MLNNYYFVLFHLAGDLAGLVDHMDIEPYEHRRRINTEEKVVAVVWGI